MKTIRISATAVSAAAGFVLLFVTATAQADDCTSLKLKALSKATAAMLKCDSKVASTNDSASLADCRTKAMARLSDSFGDAGSCTGTLSTCQDNILSQCVGLVTAAMVETFPSKCEAYKRKAAGKLSKAELGCYAKVARKDEAVDSYCVSKAVTKLVQAIAKAGSCPDGGTPTGLVEDGCVAPLATLDPSSHVDEICPVPSGTTTTTMGGGTTTTTTTVTTVSILTTSTTTTSTTSTTLPCTYVTSWGTYGTGNGQFQFTSAVAIDPSGNVFVSDTNLNRIQKFDGSGNYLTRWGSTGSGNGQFIYPINIDTDASGNVYVADYYNSRVQKFDNSGNYLTQWGPFNTMSGLAVDASGNVYVSDLYRIQKFDSSGTPLTQWGSFGGGDNQFNYSGSVAVDTGVYVFDSLYIKKFTSTGTFVTKWGGFGGGPGQYESASRITADGAGHVFSCEFDHSRIQIYDTDGNFIAMFGEYGPGPGQFIYPEGIAADGSGNLYVADRGNARIQKFACD